MTQERGFVYPGEAFDEFQCFMSGELVTIVAETNSGKTTFAMDLIKRNADKGRKGFYINLEFAVENVFKDKRLRFHNKTKANLTDLDPLSEEEKADLDRYIKQEMSKFDSYSNANGLSLQELEVLIEEKALQGYELFIIDTFSRIHGNLDSATARTSQNKCMEELQEMVQRLGIAVVMLHHTNRTGTFEGSQKIMDLSNVFILIQKDIDCDGVDYRRYTLSKDKFVHNKEVCAYYRGGKYEKF